MDVQIKMRKQGSKSHFRKFNFASNQKQQFQRVDLKNMQSINKSNKSKWNLHDIFLLYSEEQ